jgi:hypothetical protein
MTTQKVKKLSQKDAGDFEVRRDNCWEEKVSNCGVLN